ncbi:sensor domain-containing diguanylate cyclase [Pseudomonas rubra]|uniref:diguanylate cyclase n=1 Tax=Pseudomonas rubra TaxID=2942627 RepID=A0ABT5PBL1_9PSED|nr:GGDEF domain-containing protein [Pseudomonas rubra]MDD1015334.1 GGDEF domain-containing protein [Pseudomonas rubra]MDD1039556.1 GGDEF domain-containing protein [Pseudomonas rubra]MDD1154018.1 GGDEF domain-containing protein [Pseudomonas rubra]
MTETALQTLLLKRFLLAAGTYVLVLALVWGARFSGHLQASLDVLLLGGGLLLLCQVVLGWVFVSGRNLRFNDPSLTQLQILLAIAWHTWLLAQLDQSRGTFLMFYPLILLFGLFHLSSRVFVRCALLVLLSFVGLMAWDAWQVPQLDPSLWLLQSGALLVVLCWLCLYARYVQAARQRMRQRRHALQAHQDTLRGMMRQLEGLVATDELTGLFNRRHFLGLATGELERMRADHCHGLALIDLDHFKRINDLYGHAAGDQVLQAFASIASECLEEPAVLARYGGEEFVLLLPNCTEAQLADCCERLRKAFALAQPSAVGLRVEPLSLSAGMTLLGAGDDLDEALQRADQALYRAKRCGRNRCLAAWEAVDA